MTPERPKLPFPMRDDAPPEPSAINGSPLATRSRISARILPVLAFAAMAASATGPSPTLSAAPEATATAPIKNFRLPTFTDEGFRRTMIRAGEALLPDGEDRIEAKELELTLFTGKANGEIEAMLAAPIAIIRPKAQSASGPSTVRLERLDLTVTGADWSYEHGATVKKIIIRRDAHVIMRAPVGDILK